MTNRTAGNTVCRKNVTREKQARMIHSKLGDYFVQRKQRGIEGLPVVSVTIDQGVVRRSSLERRMTSDLAAEDHLLVRKGDLVYNMMRMWQGALGVAVEDGIVSPAYVVCEPKPGVNSRYFFYLLKTAPILKRLNDYSHGITEDRLRLYFQEFRSVPVNVHSASEQDSLALLFSTIDNLINHNKQLIAAKQERRTWLMQQLLTGKRRLSGFKKSNKLRKTPFGTLPADWGYPRIGDVAREVSERNGANAARPVLSCTKHQGLVDSLTYFGKRIFSEDLSNYKVVHRHQFAYATNHIDEGSIGYQDTYDEALISPIYTVFQANETMDDRFLFLILKTETYRHIFSSNTSASVDRRGSLRWHDFAKIRVPRPSIEEQKAIVKVINTADRELDLLRSQLDALREQKKGLMQLLLTGKVRVKM
jgi:type I restriction enzyme S subunit